MGKNHKLDGRTLISVKRVLHQRAKELAVSEQLPLQQVVDHLLAYGLKHVSKVAMQTGTNL